MAPTKFHKCTICEKSFPAATTLRNHMNTHTGLKPHKCKYCPVLFSTTGSLTRHIRYLHTHEKPHKCTECDYASVEMSKMKRHMRCHTGEKPFQCPHCTYVCTSNTSLKLHVRTHTGVKPYECDICHTFFTQAGSLKIHKLIHSGNKPVFQCEHCPKTYNKKVDLERHAENLHSTNVIMTCQICGTICNTKYTYKTHVKTHEGEKCYKCDLCSYASSLPYSLKTHMLIHTDQKPFRCDECNTSFRQNQQLKAHKNKCHNPNYVPPIAKERTYACLKCEKRFCYGGNLAKHMSMHNSEVTADEPLVEDTKVNNSNLSVEASTEEMQVNEYACKSRYSFGSKIQLHCQLFSM